jgi:methyl-accepting chemotaxis protein
MDPEKNETAVLLRAIERSQAWIEFTPDGEIINANDLFLDCMGYTLDEIRGKHHSMFVDSGYAHSSEYSHFWEGLKRGEYKTAEYLRVGKGGREVWLQATYTPVPNGEGGMQKVVKFATDVTEQRRSRANDTAKIEAIEKSMAVIEFNTDGTILRANDVFLDLMGYESHEIEGKHHRIFVSSEFGTSKEYTEFWLDLARGKFNCGRFERLTKTRESVWLQATYSPILDLRGSAVKVVKFAYDITAQIQQAAELDAALRAAREAERVRNELDRAVQMMSTPVTPIWEGILLLPLVGVLDSMRAADIMKKSLSMISEARAKVFVLDISGVATVDTAVANQLIKITKATKLMGCHAIVSGLSPAIAHTIVELGVDVDSIRTTATLRDAFETALAIIGDTFGGKRSADGDANDGKARAAAG